MEIIDRGRRVAFIKFWVWLHFLLGNWQHNLILILWAFLFKVPILIFYIDPQNFNCVHSTQTPTLQNTLSTQKSLLLSWSCYQFYIMQIQISNTSANIIIAFRFQTNLFLILAFFSRSKMTRLKLIKPDLIRLWYVVNVLHLRTFKKKSISFIDISF